MLRILVATHKEFYTFLWGVHPLFCGQWSNTSDPNYEATAWAYNYLYVPAVRLKLALPLWSSNKFWFWIISCRAINLCLKLLDKLMKWNVIERLRFSASLVSYIDWLSSHLKKHFPILELCINQLVTVYRHCSRSLYDRAWSWLCQLRLFTCTIQIFFRKHIYWSWTNQNLENFMCFV